MSGGRLRGLLASAFLACAAALPCPASGQASSSSWVEVRTAHFVVSSNAGEPDAWRIAEQFEQIRGVFHSIFGTLRVDPAQPIAILAVRDEATMRMLSPDEWEGEGHVHPAGLFHSDGDKDYVVLRLDAGGTTAFHTVYHEYTHALLHLNFARIPLWLNEGLAEFFGNSTMDEKGVRTGTMDKAHLWVLSKNELLPMETLLEVTESSPYYNESDRASVFYSQSWATVHYLLLDREARRLQLLSKFLVAWETSGSQMEAAHEAFGDLKRFGETIKRYSRQPDLRSEVALPAQDMKSVGYSVRNLSPGEVLAMRGEFLVRRKQLAQAEPILEQAVQLEPNLGIAHEALGLFHFRNNDFAAADQDMTRAIDLGSAGFMAFYCHGVMLLRDMSATPDVTHKAVLSLEQAARLNALFAPTFEALAQAYSRSEETQKQALEAAQKAVTLEPEDRSYQILLAYALMNNNRSSDARVVAQKLLASAGSEAETRTARALLDRVAEEQEWFKENQEADASGGNGTDEVPGTAPHAAAGANPTRPAEAARRLDPPTSMGTDGFIGAVNCAHVPEITITLNLPKGPMDFHMADARRVSVAGVSAQATPDVESCKEWKGRRVKLWFRLVQGQDYLGEISRIYFY